MKTIIVLAFALFAIFSAANAGVVVAAPQGAAITRTSIVGPSGSITQEENLPIAESAVHEPPVLAKSAAAVAETTVYHESVIPAGKSVIVDHAPVELVHHGAPVVLEKSAIYGPAVPALRYEHPTYVVGHHNLVHSVPAGFFYRTPQVHYTVPVAYKSFY